MIKQKNKFRFQLLISIVILIGIASTVAADTISGHVYKYHAPNATNTVLTKELTFNKTTQEFYSNQIYYFYTQYLHPHVSPNFFYFSCEGLTGDCDGREPMGGEVYVDNYASDGSQVELQVHTPWDTWDNTWVNNKAYLVYTYAGTDPTWNGAVYVVYISTFIGAYGNSGAVIKTQLVTTNHYDPASFVKPYCIGISTLCGITDSASMPNGKGILKNNRTTQAIYVNSSGIPDITNITSYKMKVLAELINPPNGGYITVYQPILYILLPELNRLNTPSSYIYTSIPNGVIGKQWYEIDSFTSSLMADPIFGISIGENVRIYETQLVVNYNANTTSVNEIPLQNVLVSTTTANTTTNADGFYTLPFPDNGTYLVGYNGFYAKKAGLPFYGEIKSVSFAGNTTGDDVWLNESVSAMTGQLVFSNNSNGTFSTGQKMNISYMLFHPYRTNNTFSIDVYKPDAGYSQDMIFDTTIILDNDSGNWIPNGDVTTKGLRNIYLNYTPILGGTPVTLATLSGVYGEIEPNGTISTNKSRYNLSENALIYYNTSANGRIIITCPECNDFNITYEVSAGNNKTLIFPISPSYFYGQYYAWLQYNTFGVNWNVIAMAPFLVVPSGDFVSFDQDSYGLGMSIQARVYETSNGYMLLKDPTGVIKQNSTNMSLNNFSYNVYALLFTDRVGIWTAELYNSTGALVSTDSATVISITPATPTPTPLPITRCPSGVCSGVAWTAGDTWTWMKINLPILGQVIYIVILLTVVTAVTVMIRGGRR